jgi:hypothetical protein
MEEFVPSTVIQTPDFLGMAQQRQDQMKKQKAATYNYIKDYKQTGENYLEGFIPAVQSQWNQVEQAMSGVASDDNVGTRRALDNAYANYSRVAGTAKQLTESYHTNTSAFRSDPAGFGVSFDEYDLTSQAYRFTPQTPNSLLAMSDYVLPKRKEFEINDPVTTARQFYNDLGDRIKNEFTNPTTGQINIGGAENAVRDLLDSRMNDPYSENVLKATVWGGIDSGLLGREKQIRNEQQFQFIVQQPEDKKERFLGRYNEAVVNEFLSLIPRETKPTSEAGKTIESYKNVRGYKVPSLLIYGAKKPSASDVTAFPIPESDIIETSNKYDGAKDAQGRAKELKEDIVEVMVDGNGEILVKVQGAFKDKKGNSLPPGVMAIVGNLPGVDADANRDVYTTVRPAKPDEIAKIQSNPGLLSLLEKTAEGKMPLAVDVANPLGVSGQNSVPSSSGNPLNLNLPTQ